MNILQKTAASIISLATVIGAAFAADDHVDDKLKNKVDTVTYKQFQQLVVEDKLEELKLRKFKIESIDDTLKTPIHGFELQLIDSRIEKMQRVINQ